MMEMTGAGVLMRLCEAGEVLNNLLGNIRDDMGTDVVSSLQTGLET
jgi:hypothetical protein